jgi:fructose-1,6-bisphosphatase I
MAPQGRVLVTMSPRTGHDLEAVLSLIAPANLARVLRGIASAATSIANCIRWGGLSDIFDAAVGLDSDGTARKALDVFADKVFVNGLKGAGVRAIVSEERDEPVALDEEGTLLVAIDPLDGSNNIDANVSIGTLFSVLDSQAREVEPPAFLQRGVRQRAAGFVLYGPHTDFVFTTGSGVHAATLDPDANAFRMTGFDLRVPVGSPEVAINASNSHYWPAPIRAYIDDCLEGDQGPRRRNFKMRWVGSLVADVHRILVRGGVHLSPQDSREGYEHARQRLLYEANPIALLIEQAGGGAIDGFNRILDVAPQSLHVGTPLIFGSKDEVARIGEYYLDSGAPHEAPLFGRRGLLRR